MATLVPDFLQAVQQDIDAAFNTMLPAPHAGMPQARVIEAMRYSFLAGGKRVRPALVRAWAEVSGGADAAQVVQVGLAVECLHAYSLIHDDLPCMDNDTLRRGKPTCHVAFDECTAVLAGDGLQALGFDVLAQADVMPELKVALLQTLSQAVGVCGMVGGQMIDMQHEGTDAPTLNLAELKNLQQLKTGALISASCTLGALLGGSNIDLAGRYGAALGALFQVTDDILDVTGGAALGKTTGKDAAVGKPTFVHLLGLDGAAAYADDLLKDALACVLELGSTADLLRALAVFVRNRQR